MPGWVTGSKLATMLAGCGDGSILPGMLPKPTLLAPLFGSEVGRARWARRLDAASPAVPPYPKTAYHMPTL